MKCSADADVLLSACRDRVVWLLEERTVPESVGQLKLSSLCLARRVEIVGPISPLSLLLDPTIKEDGEFAELSLVFLVDAF